MAITAPRGTQDFLPEQTAEWQLLEAKIRQICSLYGFGEIRTPMFESTELFLRGIGETTDVVTKEMYTFEDRGGRSMTLRPENTASVVRAFLEHKLYGDPQVHKFYYMGPMFRHDRPRLAVTASSPSSASKKSAPRTRLSMRKSLPWPSSSSGNWASMIWSCTSTPSAARSAVPSIARSSSISLPTNGTSSATTATNAWKEPSPRPRLQGRRRKDDADGRTFDHG